MRKFASFSVALLLFLVMSFAGCTNPAADDGSGNVDDNTQTLSAPKVTATIMPLKNGGQYVMVSYDLVPGAGNYYLLIRKGSSGNFINYQDGIEEIQSFSRMTTSTVVSVIESSLNPTSLDTFKKAYQGYMHIGTKGNSSIAPGTYYYKIYAISSSNSSVRSPDSTVVSVTIN